ncbi:MAG: S53 family peptidase [Chloroflexi bacterium]|nr:S53 family peptidase [Chloroflexota bacterium]
MPLRRSPGVVRLAVASATLAVTVGLALAAPADAAVNLRSRHAVCSDDLKPMQARCFSELQPRAGKRYTSTVPAGLSPATIKRVYGFSTNNTAGAGKTIAIVNAYDAPTVENDLNRFSSQYGLPACTTANGCFKKVNQTGGSTYPRANASWALKTSLDTQWAHAIAPGARILLVEANSNYYTDLMAAVDYAKSVAQYVSMSWGGSEFSGESNYDSRFVKSGVSFFVASGDSGLPASYPSASPNVISVGGTTLKLMTSGALASETGWRGSGGGCSKFETANAAQSAFGGYGQVNCRGKRATPDVSLDADPASGVSVYDSTPYAGQTGWFKVGGTSASTPMWAGRSAVAGVIVNSATVYSGTIGYRDITAGFNGARALVGFDLVTGRGSWIGSTP